MEESEAIAAEMQRARALDRSVARFLDQAPSAGPSASVSAIHALGDRGRLPAVLERTLLDEAIAGDRRARADLVEAFLPLIAGVAATYRSSPRITRTELMQEGVVGLLRALERFDPARDVPFWAYASWWVRQAMQQLVGELTRPVVMSDRALRQLSRIKSAAADLQREGHSPTLSRLSARTGLEERQLANLITADRPPRGLEEPISGEEGEIGAFGELIADPLAEDEYERVVTGIVSGQLRDLLSGLSDRERSILQARFGLDGESASLRDIAGRLGVSAERVRQLEGRALGKLRAAAGPVDVSDDFAKEA
ncbi:MAG TPA: sigma-70 family RNA polymerase sigma factor [Solirubrobacteraceae bacterium]|nr:sigma-70 family RNA polymerase sigma factor [Solirubrobacteraceae bacterium]